MQMKISFKFSLLKILLICISSTLVIEETETTVVLFVSPFNISYPDRQAAFGPKITSNIHGYLVPSELLPPLSPIPTSIANTKNVTSIDNSDTTSDTTTTTTTTTTTGEYPDSKYGCRQRSRPSWIPLNQTWIALVERGSCSFVEKVRAMEKSGASAVIVSNDISSGGSLITMYGPGDTSDIHIGSTFVTYRFRQDVLESTFINRRSQTVMRMRDGGLLRVMIGKNEGYELPVFDIIIISIVAPAVILAFLYSLWKYRQHRQLLLSLNSDDTNDQLSPYLTGVLSEEEVQSLPLKKYDALNMEMHECESCAICLDDFEGGEKVRILSKCGHSFHYKCIDLWLTTRRRFCPICKTEAVSSQPISPTSEEDEGDTVEHLASEDTPLLRSSNPNTPYESIDADSSTIYISVEPEDEQSHD